MTREMDEKKKAPRKYQLFRLWRYLGRYYFLIAAGLVLILVWRAYLKHAKIDKSKFDEKAMEDLKQYV